MKRLWFCSLLTLALVVGCAAPFSWTRTKDHYNAQNSTYRNETVQLQVSFPSQWKVFVKPESSREFRWVPQLEKDALTEVSMMAYHPSGTAFVSISVDKSADENLYTPIEYVKLVKQVNGKDFKDSKEIFLDERTLSGIDTADWKYTMVSDGMDFTYRELVLMNNGFACRIRCWAFSDFYYKFDSTFEEIIHSTLLFHG